VVEFATSPWGQSVPIHVAFDLIWVFAIGGLAFFIVHAIWFRYFAGEDQYQDSAPAPAGLPESIPRHSLAARMFHWIMASSMLTLLITAFLPKVCYQFAWVTYHWIAGLVLSASILFHVVHTTFFLDPWSIWPDKTDWEDAKRRWARATGKQAEKPRRFAK